ncbi:hypothetical protein GCM10027277_29700 [Pseudoduganella ginsengisoli]
MIDELSGLPASDWHYTIELANGWRLEGRTDQYGKTSKITAAYAADAVVHVYAPDPTPINPFWDR